MIHIYHGDGKGKTTAACGLALRAAGHQSRVLFAQFFKDGSSGEIAAMAAFPNIETRRPSFHPGRWVTLTESDRAAVRQCCREYIADIVSQAARFDMIVLDELISAYNHGCLERGPFLDFLRAQGPLREIVLTGRDPAPELIELADYVTEMRKEKHPFDIGISARKGVEY